MGQKADRMPRTPFLDALRDDLHHLYDAEHLRASPLAAICGVENRFDTATALRTILIDAIECLKPDDDTPPDGRGWLVYEALSGCYVQQLGQKVVADQLGISVRHLRRELRSAAEALADDLWQKHCRDMTPQGEPSLEEPSLPQYEELAWLRDLPPTHPVALGPAVREVFDLARPLASERNVRLVSTIGDDVPALAVHSVALTQALLSVLTVAVARSESGGEVRVSAAPSGWDVDVGLDSTAEADGRAVDSSADPNDTANLELAGQIALLCGGALRVPAHHGARFGATLSLPALEQVPVLAIDDHPDTLRLLRRYTTGTRYRLLETNDVEEALSLATSIRPEVIVLDVLMPKVDGWRVLARLREHPLTRGVPTIVCTIMAQRNLALSLGASDFLKKPITRHSFLAALERQVVPRATELR